MIFYCSVFLCPLKSVKCRHTMILYELHRTETDTHDIDLAVLPKYHLTYETYFPEADDLAEFIFTAKREGKDIICQCEYGERRSSGCVAAIHEYFYKDGIKIFADYRYYPNQMVYHKVYDALERYGIENDVIRESGE